MIDNHIWRQPIEGQLGLLDESLTNDTPTNADACRHRGEWPCLDCLDCIGRFGSEDER